MADDVEKQIEAQSKLAGLKKEKVLAAASREANLSAAVAASRNAHEGSKKSLKSDLKKTTAFVKKVRAITVEGISQCIKEVDVLNLSLYIEEIVAAIVETKFKATDVPSIVQLSSGLHKRYETFTPPLLQGLREALLSAPMADDPSSGKRKRIQLRLLLELFQAGVLEQDTFFVRYLYVLVGKNGTGGKKTNPVDLGGLTTYIKYGAESLLGYPSMKLQALAREAGMTRDEIPLTLLSQEESRVHMQTQITETYDNLCDTLNKALKDLRLKERKADRDKSMHGSLSEQKTLELEQARTFFEKIQSTVSSLSEALGKDVPELEDEEEEEEDDLTTGISMFSGGNATGDFGAFEDAEQRSFYEDLPDLLSMVPLAALGFSQEKAAEIRESWKAKKDEAPTLDGGSSSNVSDMDALEAGSSKDDGKKDVSGNAADGGGTTAKLTLLLEEKLPECYTKAKADEFCVAFCYNNNKSARKRLVDAMLGLPRNRMELVPLLCSHRSVPGAHLR